MASPTQYKAYRGTGIVAQFKHLIHACVFFDREHSDTSPVTIKFHGRVVFSATTNRSLSTGLTTLEIATRNLRRILEKDNEKNSH